MLVSALVATDAGAQTAESNWAVNVHFSPYLFEGQINQAGNVYDYSYHTFLGIDLTRILSEYFSVSLSLGYTKSKANIIPPFWAVHRHRRTFKFLRIQL